MLTNFLYDYISSDKKCLFGLLPDKDKFAKLISPLNANHIWPVETSNDYTNWIQNKNILVNINDKAENIDNWFSSNEPWEFKTGLSLIGIEDDVFTFSSKININISEAEMTDPVEEDDPEAENIKHIQLFKQGDLNEPANGLIDIHFDINKEFSEDDIKNSLVINLYYENSKMLTYELTENIDALLNKDVQLTIVINLHDQQNKLIKVFADDVLIGEKLLDESNLEEIELRNAKINVPVNIDEFNNFYVGDINSHTNLLKIKNIFIWNRSLIPNEIKFLNKIIF